MSDGTFGRGCLFAASVSAAIVAGVGTLLYFGLTPTSDGYGFAWENLAFLAIPSIVVGAVVGLLYPVVAAFAVSACELLRKIAFPHISTQWDSDSRAILGAIWPLSLAFWLMIAPFYAIINRLFK
ncbi:MAG: hypothetical protein QOD75_120 [Blastocatellia bacterium]|jgi:hypothetical protein|nr:hypothetical protein [Blastocatellia bacterium]